MSRTISLIALAAVFSWTLPAFAHHHHQQEGDSARFGATSGMIVLAEVTQEARTRAHSDGATHATLSGKRVAVLIGEGFHDGETTIPSEFLAERGAEVTLVGTSSSRLTAYNSDLSLEIEKTLSEVCVQDFDALIIPGGHSPRNLRDDRNVRRFVRAFVESGKPVAAICHGPQVLASAGVLRDRTITGFGAIRGEMIDAGARFVDRPVVRDENLITSRLPGDLPLFNESIAASLGNASR